jgi:hypothetical protein
MKNPNCEWSFLVFCGKITLPFPSPSSPRKKRKEKEILVFGETIVQVGI